MTAAELTVAFDIETTGLDPTKDTVTAACAFGPGVEATCLFKNIDRDADMAERERFMGILDAAPRLCAFNGIRFDIPFLHTAWGVPASRVEAWVIKTFDVYEACRLSLNATFPLSRLLALNDMESKTGSGLEAIALAQKGQWDALGAYCMQDTRLTYLVSTQPAIALPVDIRTGRACVLTHDAARPFVLRSS